MTARPRRQDGIRWLRSVIGLHPGGPHTPEPGARGATRLGLNVTQPLESVMGELEQRESVTSLELPGQTVISANVAGAKDIVVNAKPGHTHYVRMDVKLRGTSLKISFTEVEEQVAQVEKPELFSAI